MSFKYCKNNYYSQCFCLTSVTNQALQAIINQLVVHSYKAIALINFSIESRPDDGVPFETIAFLLGVKIWSLLVWLLSDLSYGVESELLAKQLIPLS